MLTLFSQQQADDMEIAAERKEQEHTTKVLSIKALMESMGWSAEVAMNALKIPASEHSQYLPELA